MKHTMDSEDILVGFIPGLVGSVLIIIIKVLTEIFNQPMILVLFNKSINLTNIISNCGIGGILALFTIPGFIIGLIYAFFPDSKIVKIILGIFILIVVSCVVFSIVSAIEALQMTFATILIIIGIIIATSFIVIVV